jgi:hypothetical protein
VPIAKIPSNFMVTYHEAFPIQADLSAKAKTQNERPIGWCASQSGVLW